jgi:ABC-type transport system substrate-binding protein
MYFGTSIRALALFLATAFLFSAVPMTADTPPPVGEVAAIGEDYVQVGWLNMEISFWNPLTIQMVEDYVATYLMYSALWTYDQDWSGPVGDLALEWDTEPQANGSMNTYVRITDNAYFRNIDNLEDTSQKLTAYDVSWSFNLIMNNTGYTFDWYLRDIYEIEVLSETELVIKTTFVKATLIDDLSGVPILCEDYWGDLPNPMAKNMAADAQLGTGPFVFEDSVEGSWYAFKTAPNYYGEVEYGAARTVDIPGIMYSVYTDVNAIALALNEGDVDVVNLAGDVTTYNDVLGVGTTLDIDKFAVTEPGICDVAINGIPAYFDSPTYYDGNPILRDPFVRKAIMMTLNKTYITGTLLDGLAEQAASVVQPGYWQADVVELDFNPYGAWDVLEAAGYEDTNGDGVMEATSASMAVDEGWCNVGDELVFRCEAPDTDPNYYEIAQAWVGEAAKAGIVLEAAQLSEGLMTSISWYKSDYDIWVWHWGWGPEPIGAALTCWLTEEIKDGGYNCQGPMGPWWVSADNYTSSPFVNASMIEEFGMAEDTFIGFSAFDQNISFAQQTLDVADRKVILDKLQQWIYDSYTENPPYYDLGLYGVSNARFTNWGDWSLHNGLPITSDLLWVWYSLESADNLAPDFTSDLNAEYQATVDQIFEVTIEVMDADGDPITLNCSWGDGASEPSMELTGDTTVPEQVTFSHTYSALATDLDLVITAWDGQPNHEVATSALVDVLEQPDYGPVIVGGSLVGTPASPVYVDQEVAWTVQASDAETDETGELKFTWVWDDGTYDVSFQTPADLGAVVTDEQTHTWTDIGTMLVEVWVFDGFEDDETSTIHNVSATKTYSVIENTAPYSLSAPDILWTPDSWATVTGSAIDDDPDTLTFTWEWDDGTFNVTSALNTDPGTQVSSSVKHMWDADGTYDVTLWVDDGNGHNVSLAVTATISGNPGPTALTAVQDPDPALVDEEITFAVSASDANSDALTMTLVFGDGELAVATTAGGTTEAQTSSFTHTYTTEGPFSATLYADDGTTNSSLAFTVRVVANEAPEITLQSSFSAQFNVSFEISPIEVSDADGDEVTVWYDWGDDTPMTMGETADYYSASHTYMELGQFTVTAYADDGMGHNSTATVVVTVTESNFKPVLVSITKAPVADSYLITEVITFTVSVRDSEGDTVTVMIDFGDGETDEETIDTEPNNVVATVTFEHAYDEAGDYEVEASVTDGMDHYDMTPSSNTADVAVVQEPTETNWALIAGIGLLILVVILALLLLMKRKKKGSEAGMEGMEGMAAPGEQAPPS